MNSHADRTQENKSQSVANGISRKQIGRESIFNFVDNRPEAIAQKKLIENVNSRNSSIQPAKIKGKAGDYDAQVRGYPTLEGNAPAKGHIPLCPDCLAKARAISAELESYPPEEVLKSDERGLSGFMIGVALVDGEYVGATSGNASARVFSVIKKHVEKVVSSNVQDHIAKTYLGDTGKLDQKFNRHRVVPDEGIPGGMAGVCAAFKIAHNYAGRITGMAEILFAPRGVGPHVTVNNKDREEITYEHNEAVPSCATCQIALPNIIRLGKSAAAAAPKQTSKEEQIEKFRDKMLLACVSWNETIAAPGKSGKIGELFKRFVPKIQEAKQLIEIIRTSENEITANQIIEVNSVLFNDIIEIVSKFIEQINDIDAQSIRVGLQEAERSFQPISSLLVRLAEKAKILLNVERIQTPQEATHAMGAAAGPSNPWVALFAAAGLKYPKDFEPPMEGDDLKLIYKSYDSNIKIIKYEYQFGDDSLEEDEIWIDE